MTTLDMPFTRSEVCDAITGWGCNCGPSALAFARGVSLDDARAAIAGFDEKRYTSPTMMKGALHALCIPFAPLEATIPEMFLRGMAISRVQWTGPWTKPGSNPMWAYRQTHWVATWSRAPGEWMVFDINSGIVDFDTWEVEVVPDILRECVPRADGGWCPTHVWPVDRI